MVSGDFEEGQDSTVGSECDEEEMLLKQAIALSLEVADENDNKEKNNTEEEEEEELLRQAIALSLEGADEEDY